VTVAQPFWLAMVQRMNNAAIGGLPFRIDLLVALGSQLVQLLIQLLKLFDLPPRLIDMAVDHVVHLLAAANGVIPALE
tara:strand:+ start:3098 stop:3331 length:234 start_codon:yes stop_codon:yes gene_type:complete